MYKISKVKNNYMKATNGVNIILDKVFILANKTGLQKVFASILSVILGLLVAGIFIAAQDKSFIKAYKYIVLGAFQHGNWKVTMVYMSAYILFGLSVAFSFKAGLFNIGGSGQMLLSAGFSIWLMFKLSSVSIWMFILAFGLCIVIGFVWASIAGICKSLFNVHEVVTTILLNWIAFYIVQQLFDAGTPFYSGTGNPSSKPITSIANIPEIIKKYAWIISLGLSSITIAIVWFIFKKTTFGFNLKVVGESQDVARYSGISVKTKVTLIMGISGAISGLGGGILYLLNFQSIDAMATLPTYGFDGIVIALLAFNSPIGIILSALFYGILNKGAGNLEYHMGLGEEIYQVVVGIIIYFTTFSMLITKFQPILWLQHLLVVRRTQGYKKAKENYIKNKKELKINFRKEYAFYLETIKNNKRLIKDAKHTKKVKLKTLETNNEFNKKTYINVLYEKSLTKYGVYMGQDLKLLFKVDNKENKNIFKAEKKAVIEASNVLKLKIHNIKVTGTIKLVDLLNNINVLVKAYNKNINLIIKLDKAEEVEMKKKSTLLSKQNIKLLSRIESQQKSFDKKIETYKNNKNFRQKKKQLKFKNMRGE